METSGENGLPSSQGLEEWLGLSLGSGIADLMDDSLLKPLNAFLNRPSKKFRARLVQIGFDLVSGQKESHKKLVPKAQQVLEAIHAASLVVDDIQDNSDWRRGEPTLHKTVGLAVALNSANWLYFWPFENIEHWDVPLETKSQLFRACHRALIRAHSGQALDVGTPISEVPKSRVSSICLSSLELKTGALTALAFELGAYLAQAESLQVSELSQMGVQFGVALQMFDDLGNIKKRNPPDPKRFEDLKGRRPSWIWAAASQWLTDSEYRQFLSIVETLPREDAIAQYFQQAEWVEKAFHQASVFLDGAVNQLGRQRWNSSAFNELTQLAQQLKRSYE